jgi:hypothetical protein
MTKQRGTTHRIFPLLDKPDEKEHKCELKPQYRESPIQKTTFAHTQLPPFEFSAIVYQYIDETSSIKF